MRSRDHGDSWRVVYKLLLGLYLRPPTCTTSKDKRFVSLRACVGQSVLVACFCGVVVVVVAAVVAGWSTSHQEPHPKGVIELAQYTSVEETSEKKKTPCIKVRMSWSALCVCVCVRGGCMCVVCLVWVWMPQHLVPSGDVHVMWWVCLVLITLHRFSILNNFLVAFFFFGKMRKEVCCNCVSCVSCVCEWGRASDYGGI